MRKGKQKQKGKIKKLQLRADHNGPELVLPYHYTRKFDVANPNGFTQTEISNYDMDNETRDTLSGPHWKGDVSSILLDPSCPATLSVPVKALNITWGNDPRFWQWIRLSEEETRSTGFHEGALLLQVNWIEVTGKLPKTIFQIASDTKYEIYYVMKFQIDAFGWHSVPIKFKIKLNGEETVKSVVLESYRKKNDVWHEICGGEFTVSKNRAGVVEFGMFEVESDWWKGSMALAGVKIKPKTG